MVTTHNNVHTHLRRSMHTSARIHAVSRLVRAPVAAAARAARPASRDVRHHLEHLDGVLPALGAHRLLLLAPWLKVGARRVDELGFVGEDGEEGDVGAALQERVDLELQQQRRRRRARLGLPS